MAYDGTEGSFLDPETAQRWIARYQDQEPFGIKAELFGKEKMMEILNQPEAIAFRVYYAKDDNEGWRLIFVGVDKDGRNLGPIAGGNAAGLLLERGVPCPPYCPPT